MVVNILVQVEQSYGALFFPIGKLLHPCSCDLIYPNIPNRALIMYMARVCRSSTFVSPHPLAGCQRMRLQ